MKILEILEIAIAPIILMSYGLYLALFGESMQDLAGILMFITGIVGLIIGLIVYFSTPKWKKKWYWNVLIGIAGCILVFVGLIIYARISG